MSRKIDLQRELTGSISLREYHDRAALGVMNAVLSIPDAFREFNELTPQGSTAAATFARFCYDVADAMTKEKLERNMR